MGPLLREDMPRPAEAGPRRPPFLQGAVFLLFVAASICQGLLPLLHVREVDIQEASEFSCKGHPPSHVEKDRGPSHHDSGSCGVCQFIHSMQPSEGPAAESLTLLVQSATHLPFDLQSLDLRGPPLTGSRPRAPPSSL